MIEKFLLFKESASSTPSSGLNASSKASFSADLPSKTNKRCDQADLGYFNPHCDKAHDKAVIVLVGKNVYYKNVILFIKYL